MAKIEDVAFISAKNYKKLGKKVAKFLGSGFELQGDVQLNVLADGTIQYMQPVVKYEEPVVVPTTVTITYPEPSISDLIDALRESYIPNYPVYPWNPWWVTPNWEYSYPIYISDSIATTSMTTGAVNA